MDVEAQQLLAWISRAPGESPNSQKRPNRVIEGYSTSCHPTIQHPAPQPHVVNASECVHDGLRCSPHGAPTSSTRHIPSSRVRRPRVQWRQATSSSQTSKFHCGEAEETLTAEADETSTATGGRHPYSAVGTESYDLSSSGGIRRVKCQRGRKGRRIGCRQTSSWLTTPHSRATAEYN